MPLIDLLVGDGIKAGHRLKTQSASKLALFRGLFEATGVRGGLFPSGLDEVLFYQLRISHGDHVETLFTRLRG